MLWKEAFGTFENLTKTENETFKLIRSFTMDYNIEEQQKKEKPRGFSLVVAGGGLEPPTSGL